MGDSTSGSRVGLVNGVDPRVERRVGLLDHLKEWNGRPGFDLSRAGCHWRWERILRIGSTSSPR